MGEAQAAYDRVPLVEAQDYNKVKGTILHWLEVIEEVHRQQFQKLKTGAMTTCQLTLTLGDEARRWLWPQERNTGEVAVMVHRALLGLRMERRRQWIDMSLLQWKVWNVDSEMLPLAGQGSYQQATITSWWKPGLRQSGWPCWSIVDHPNNSEAFYQDRETISYHDQLLFTCVHITAIPLG